MCVIYLYIYIYHHCTYSLLNKQCQQRTHPTGHRRNDGNSGLPAVSSPKSDTGLVGISVGTWENLEKWMVGTSIRLHYIQCVYIYIYIYICIYIYIYLFMMMIPIFKVLSS